MRRYVASAFVALTALLVAVAGVGTAAAESVSLTGAGASFPYPIYSKWIDEYHKLHPTVTINYQSIGSGGGIRQITAKTVDFGGSDAFLTDEQLKAAPGELIHIPTVMGAVVITYNVPGVTKSIKLTPDVVADLFLGKITRWNDTRITSLNPDVRFPNMPVSVVHRSDGSGTTFIFTSYLSKVSPEWRSKVGAGTSVSWPVGVGAPQNDGVAGQVRQIPGAVGYVELAYALQNKMPYAALRNRDGYYVLPSLETTSNAAAGIEMPEDYRVLVVDAAGKDSYPIAAFTWILVYKEQSDPVKGKALVDFLWWALHDGQKYAPALEYAPLPEAVVKRLEGTLRQITYQGKPLIEK
ncbi:MAG: phosphate ABC transporter substrate-binding protein PstS [Limnochordaceae bacterium]|nr:phosphate ABC transporter substrate-binding protein PstS [Limnochordaceae bacterium]